MFEFILGVCFIFLGKWVGRKAVTVALLQWWLSPMSNETLDLKSLKVVASLYHVYTINVQVLKSIAIAIVEYYPYDTE